MTEIITNQSVAVGVLIIVFTGIGLGSKYLFDFVKSEWPKIADRVDQIEATKAAALEKLGDRIETSTEKTSDRVERSMDKFTNEVRTCLQDVKESVEESSKISAIFVSHLQDLGGNGVAK